MNTCYIACALPCKIDISYDETDLLIGADKGYFNFLENSITPHVAMGDFDSYTGEILCENTIKYPVKKDFTDSALAIEYAISKGYRKIIVFGGIGGALDHTVANIALVASYTEKGIDIAFVHEENILFAVSNSKIAFDENAKGRISVFSYGDKSSGVNEKGLLYSLDDYTLENLTPLGVSNEFINEKSEISVSCGTLLVYTSKENYFSHLTRE